MNHSLPAGAPLHLVEDLDRALDAAPPSAVRRSDVPVELLVRPTVPRLLRIAAEEWAMLGALWLAMAALPRPVFPYAWPALALLVAGRLHALGVVLHDAAHMPLRRKSAAARLLEVLCGYPIAITLEAMRYHHIRHHRDNGMPTDPYFKDGVEDRPGLRFAMWVRGIILIPFWTVRPVFGLMAYALPGLRNAYGRVFLQDRSGADLREAPEVVRCAREELGQLIFQAAVFALWARFPAAVLYGYVIPVLAVGLLSSNRLLAEHVYRPTGDRRVETMLATTCDHGFGPFGRLVTAPRNIGYHIVHHLHPQVSLEHLPRLRRWYVDRYGDRYPAAGRARSAEAPPR
jgi:fatty acid desaturase